VRKDDRQCVVSPCRRPRPLILYYVLSFFHPLVLSLMGKWEYGICISKKVWKWHWVPCIPVALWVPFVFSKAVFALFDKWLKAFGGIQRAMKRVQVICWDSWILNASVAHVQGHSRIKMKYLFGGATNQLKRKSTNRHDTKCFTSKYGEIKCFMEFSHYVTPSDVPSTFHKPLSIQWPSGVRFFVPSKINRWFLIFKTLEELFHY